MKIREDLIASVGNTPLIKLRRASEMTGCTILGKAEFLNPGGSVKDRAAKYIVLDGERRGVIEPGGLLKAPQAIRVSASPWSVSHAAIAH
jgi:cysteine synthase A